MRHFITKQPISFTALAVGALFCQETAFAQQDPLQLTPLPPIQNIAPETPDSESEPAYSVTMLPHALAEAQAKHLPIAWVYGSRADFLTQPNAATSDSIKSDLTFLTFGCLSRFRQQVVTVGITGKSGLNQLPPFLKQQFLVPDDGPPQDNEANVQTPKIVFTNSTGDVVFARIPFSQLQAMGETAICNGLYGILHNPQDTQILGRRDLAPANPSSSDAPSSNIVSEASVETSTAVAYAAHLGEIFLILFAGLCVVMALLGVRLPSLPRNLEKAPGVVIKFYPQSQV